MISIDFRPRLAAPPLTCLGCLGQDVVPDVKLSTGARIAAGAVAFGIAFAGIYLAVKMHRS